MQQWIESESDPDDTIGFLVTHPEWFHHFRPIIDLLDVHQVEVVLHGTQAEIVASRSFAEGLGWKHSLADERIGNQRRLAMLVSGHPFRLMEDWLPRQLADVNVRLMYALGKAQWNFSDWNEIYDVILCFGPYHAQRLARFSWPLVVQVGYPRYSRYFSAPPDRQELLRRLRCDAAKRTLLWLPTWKALSSIDRFAECIGALAGEYNLVIKPHPLSITTEPERIARLAALPGATVLTDLVDNGDLFCIADTVLCDYGGPAFGAVYLDRNLLLLDVAGADSDELMGPDSAELLLRQHIAAIALPDAARLRAMLADEALWAEQGAKRGWLRRRFFAPYRENAAATAAGAIRKIQRLRSERRTLARQASAVERFRQWLSG
ncbi:MAG: hypothetical protein A3F77_11315 [Betaproteobacteria bacterium RIFCSPLOWO2_12_FULL_67_28]|nr:MAG: hypothetical protein A3F77_11315 [Betaproteobacteria bacterium RIFCSPLOWO2_12_FULL_67_28]